MLSTCGKDCATCNSFPSRCKGCYHTRPEIPKEKEQGMCPIYACMMERFESRKCSDCPDLPCEKFSICVNPRHTKDEALRDIERRVKALKQERDEGVS